MGDFCMKKLYAYNIIFLLLMVNTLSMYGMYTTRTVRQGTRQARQAAARRTVLSGRQQARASRVAAGQSKGYGTAVVPQGKEQKKGEDGWWKSFTSIFKHQLTPEEFIVEFEKCIYRMGDWTSPNGRTFTLKLLFDDNDLQNAKRMINDNEQFINNDISDKNIPSKKRMGTYHWGYVAWKSGSFPTDEERQEYHMEREKGFQHLRIADRVLDAIFRGETASTDDFYF